MLKIARCPETSCDNNGTIANQISEDEWEPQQCQWCDEKKAITNTQNDEQRRIEKRF